MTMAIAGELDALEAKLEDAVTRFDRMPGALWLAATAIVESATRLGDALPGSLAERRTDLLVRARRARDDAGPRSSENDVSAITAWVELAEKRAALETKVQGALRAVAEHRAAHAFLGAAPDSRAALERALSDRERDVVERAARLAGPVDEHERRIADAADAPIDEATPDRALEAAAAEARARLASGSGRGLPLVALGLALAGAGTALSVDVTLARAIGGGVALLGVVAAAVLWARAGARRAQDVVAAHALRRRDEARAKIAEEDQQRLVAAARALGALDAFGATDEGRTLEDRESKLVALAPWIRELVSGFSADEARRFG